MSRAPAAAMRPADPTRSARIAVVPTRTAAAIAAASTSTPAGSSHAGPHHDWSHSAVTSPPGCPAHSRTRPRRRLPARRHRGVRAAAPWRCPRSTPSGAATTRHRPRASHPRLVTTTAPRASAIRAVGPSSYDRGGQRHRPRHGRRPTADPHARRAAPPGGERARPPARRRGRDRALRRRATASPPPGPPRAAPGPVAASISQAVAATHSVPDRGAPEDRTRPPARPGATRRPVPGAGQRPRRARAAGPGCPRSSRRARRCRPRCRARRPPARRRGRAPVSRRPRGWLRTPASTSAAPSTTANPASEMSPNHPEVSAPQTSRASSPSATAPSDSDVARSPPVPASRAPRADSAVSTTRTMVRPTTPSSSQAKGRKSAPATRTHSAPRVSSTPGTLVTRRPLRRTAVAPAGRGAVGVMAGIVVAGVGPAGAAAGAVRDRICPISWSALVSSAKSCIPSGPRRSSSHSVHTRGAPGPTGRSLRQAGQRRGSASSFGSHPPMQPHRERVPHAPRYPDLLSTDAQA